MSNICCPYLHEKLFTGVQLYEVEAASWTCKKQCRRQARRLALANSLINTCLRFQRTLSLGFQTVLDFLLLSQIIMITAEKSIPTPSKAALLLGPDTGSLAWLTQGIVSATACGGLWPLEGKWEKAQSANPKHFLSCYTTQVTRSPTTYISSSFYVDTKHILFWNEDFKNYYFLNILGQSASGTWRPPSPCLGAESPTSQCLALAGHRLWKGYYCNGCFIMLATRLGIENRPCLKEN